MPRGHESEPLTSATRASGLDDHLLVAVRGALLDLHRHNTARVASAVAPGSFPVGSPNAHAIVVDANHLRDEVVRRARGHGPTILLGGAAAGTFLVYCAPHVAAEVDEHLEEWATSAGVDPEKVRRAWLEDVSPLLRTVDLPDELLTPEERAPLEALCTDPDDRPTAALAMVLDAALLGRDKRPLAAVYGPAFDHEDHATHWLRRLAAAGDLVVLRDAAQAARVLVDLVAVGAGAGTRAAAQRLPRWATVTLSLASGAALVGVVHRQRSTISRAIGTAGDVVVAVSTVFSQARLEAGLLTPHERHALEGGGPGSPSVVARAVVLALAPASKPLSLQDITDQVRADFPSVRPSAVRAALTSLRCVRQITPDTFQLGVPYSGR